MTRSLAAGLVGYGYAGRRIHAPLLEAAGLPLVGVVSRQGEAVHSDRPAARVHTDLDSLLADPAVELVVIATPNSLHHAQASAALRAGKHVVVDKPLAVTSREARELVQLAAETDRVLSPFQNRRWDADFLTIRRILAEGRLGEIRSFHARWDRYRPTVRDRWREQPGPGSGVLYDLGAHLLDQVLCLFGMPEWIQADVFAQRDGARAADGFELLMGKGALRLSVGASSIAAEGGARYLVHGTRGSFVKSGLDVQEAGLVEGLSPLDPAFGREPEAIWGTLVEGETARGERVVSEQGAWLEYYRAIRRCIESQSPVPVAAGDAVQGLALIEAALRSSEEGRRVSLASSRGDAPPA